MIRIDFTPADLARLRFAHSPMAEVVASSRVLSQQAAFGAYSSWRARVRRQLPRAGLETFEAAVSGPTGYVPDFLTPVPATGRPSLADELQVVAATPADRVAREIAAAWAGHQAPPQIARFGTDPAGGLSDLVGQIRSYFALAVAPLWPRLRAVAQGEITHRALAAAERGPRALLADLHPLLDWDGAELQLAYPKNGQWALDGHPLALLPTGFAGQKMYSMPASPTGRALWYAPQGYARLWDQPPPPGPARALAALLGPTRAAVLTLLAVPCSTGEVAAALDLAPATASHHLTTLRDAGLVAGERAGRRLRYLRTSLGEQLSAGPDRGIEAAAVRT